MAGIRPNRYRTHTCSELRADDDGREVRLSGWVHSARDQKTVRFIDLRDRYGITQIVVEDAALRARVAELLVESTVSVRGRVRKRLVMPKEKHRASRLPTAEIEVVAKEVEILTAADPVPFSVADTEGRTSEELRLRYRFLDLRRARMQHNLRMRAEVISYIRRFMENEGFWDIATPILGNSSPEGARDFLVPSRLHPGKFYALPQAPQQFKQLLMVAGCDRYYQIAPCFRDEDARADRSPGEFYQLDLEMAFAEMEDVFDVVERLFTGLTEHFELELFETPFPRMTYDEALRRYGTDKPDLRLGMEIEDVTSLFAGSGFGILASAAADGRAIRAIRVEGGAGWSGSKVKKYDGAVKKAGGHGVLVFGFDEGSRLGLKDGTKLSESERERLQQAMEAKPEDIVLMVADDPERASKLLGALRTQIGAEHLKLDPKTLAWGWITDFPMFERDPESGRIEFGHNPFSMPTGGLKALEEQEPTKITAQQYDLFCNGLELSSGAVRNYDPQVMYKAFEIAGYAKEEVDRQFGHMLDAFRLGAPPHAGLAPGIERIVMLVTGEPNLREVVPFPKNQQAQDLMLGAPSEVSEAQLREVHIGTNLPDEPPE